MKQNKNNILARLGLFCATVIWGSSFFITKNIFDSIPAYYILAVRFTVGATFLTLIFIRRYKLIITLEYITRGTVMGVLLFCALAFQTYGLLGTTPGKNAFLTAVYCVLVPFAYWAFAKIKPDRYNVLAAAFCLAGIGLVSLTSNFTMVMGDFLTLVGGVFFALHIVAVSKFARGRDIFVLTIWQFVAAAAVSWIMGLLFNEFPTSIPNGAIYAMVYLCVGASTIGLLLQNIGQKYVPPSSASIILSLESVFGVLCSVIFYGEVLTFKIALGFVVIFLAILISETKGTIILKKGVKYETKNKNNFI